MKHSFLNAHIVFATHHHKGAAAITPFGRVLNATIEELDIDSDSLGTFSGEIERPGSMLDALRGKIHLARRSTSQRFVLASEGSFGSAGGFGFSAEGIEMLMLHDAVTGAEIIEQHISFDNNYATQTVASAEELNRFLSLLPLGSHALVLMPAGLAPTGNVFKGITTPDEAFRAFETCRSRSPSGGVIAMSDMRAHLNPTRMKAISACCELMAKRLSTPCPTCGSGGFGLVATVPGLPCEWCGSPTLRAKAETHACPFCRSKRQLPRSDGKKFADPGECESCNP